jgi:hypothetical protein
MAGMNGNSFRDFKSRGKQTGRQRKRVFDAKANLSRIMEYSPFSRSWKIKQSISNKRLGCGAQNLL